ncbi:hypothetical protein Tco_1020285 [Tanacetum coccineum]|uniref:Uncharacterized protein n=1 Tax=Tanacetum coccineum TaxID=301880 RepID=A0ABQ5G102_9ASTR
MPCKNVLVFKMDDSREGGYKKSDAVQKRNLKHNEQIYISPYADQVDAVAEAGFSTTMESSNVISFPIPSTRLKPMQEELLHSNGFQDGVFIGHLYDLPYGKKAIGKKWVYRNKKDEQGYYVLSLWHAQGILQVQTKVYPLWNAILKRIFQIPKRGARIGQESTTARVVNFLVQGLELQGQTATGKEFLNPVDGCGNRYRWQSQAPRNHRGTPAQTSTVEPKDSSTTMISLLMMRDVTYSNGSDIDNDEGTGKLRENGVAITYRDYEDFF